MKPLLLGMNNPLSDDPEYDIYPYPEGSTGWRLWKMLPEGTTRAQYLDMFDRRNLLRAREWHSAEARRAAELLLPDLAGRAVVVLGTQVRAALDLPQTEPLVWRRCLPYEFNWIAVPHPSGRNCWYNEPGRRDQVGAMLRALAEGVVNPPAGGGA